MIVIGIDPSIAVGKPAAIVIVDTDKLRVLNAPEDAVPDDVLIERLLYWSRRLKSAKMRAGWPTEDVLVAIEDSRGIGGKGSAYLQALVTILKDQAESMGVPVVLVKPSEAKAAVRKGNSTKEEIAETIRMLMDCSKLPDGYDWTDAVAIALAGERKWHIKQLAGGD